MKPVSQWRMIMIGAVTLISIALILPTGRYLLGLEHEPDPADAEVHAAWQEKMDGLREKTIPLGLDLSGGVDVQLTIDQNKIIQNNVQSMVATLKESFANNTINARVLVAEDSMALTVQALDAGDVRKISNSLQNYASLIGDKSEAALATLEPVRFEIDSRSLEDAVSGAISGAEKIIRQRVDKLGLSQPSITIEGNSRIRIQLAGETDPDTAIKNISRLAEMEFRLAYEGYGTPNDPILALLDENGELLPDADIPLGAEVVPYRFGNWDEKTGEMVYREGKMLVDSDVLLRGKDLRSARVFRDQFDLQNPNQVSIQFTNEGAAIFLQTTKNSAEKFKRNQPADHLAVLLDGVVISAPTMEEAIPGGSAVIRGGFSFEEARDLSLLLKAGSLPAPLKVESKEVVGASLGTESILAGVNALFWGGLAVIVFMALYYGMAGVISIAALSLNVLLILAILALADATLTLSGIGGILLTIGMAVDANVLIYERIREELDAGRPLKQAMATGFDRAFTVILDSNLTTLMTALILLQFTSGSVRGFALTMAFGLIANLYTGLTVTRTLCAYWFQMRGKLSLGPLRPFAKSQFDFIRARIVAWGVSIALIVGGIVLVTAEGGLGFGVDFSGGVLARVRFTQSVDETSVRAMLTSAGLEGQRVQSIPGTNDYQIRVHDLDLTDEQTTKMSSLTATQQRLEKGLVDAFGEDGFERPLTVTAFGAETGQGFRKMAISVIILASFAILLYLWLRFELVFGAAAVVALIHDMALTVLWSSVWGVDITLDVVAALMVMLGFSVNDTIVIFDRVRENVRRESTRSFREICNLSMNQSLSRTLITSGTALLVIVIMLFVGGEGLKPFAKVLLIGTIVGTYSSNFIAAPIVYVWNKHKKDRLVKTLAEKHKPRGPQQAKAPQGAGGRRIGRAGASRRAV